MIGQGRRLDLIMIEDSDADAELEADVLREDGMLIDIRRVENEPAFRAALDQRLPDAILADWKLPHFRGQTALDIAHQRCPEVPFIFVSGTISETTAIEAMRHGATDYVFKHQLQQLVPALTRGLDEAQTLRSLRQSRDFTFNILNSLLQHIAVLDEYGVIVAVNQSWRDFARDNAPPGGPQESVGVNYLDICSAAPAYDFAEEAATVLDGLRDVLAGIRPEFSLEYPCHSPDEKRWFIMHVTPLPGAFAGVVVAHENITPRKLAEHAVRLSEERFSAFFQHAMVGMSTTSIEQGWILVNPALCKILGYPKEELLKKSLSELTHPDDRAIELPNIQRLVNGATDHYSMEKRFIRPNGEIVHTFTAVSLVRRTERHLAFFATLVEDISERKLVEESILNVQRLTQQFLDHLPGIAFIKDENLRVLMANKTFQTLLGMDPGAMIGKSNTELFPNNFGQKLDEDDRRALESGQSTVIEEDFEGRFFETSKFVIEGETGKRLLGGITLEITQRQRHLERQEALLRISELGGMLPEKAFLEQGLEMIERLTMSQIGFVHFVNEDQESIELVAWTAGALKGCTAVHEKHYPMGMAGIWADCARKKEAAIFNDYPGYRAKKGLPEGHAPLFRLISVPVIEEDQVRLILGVGNKATDYNEDDVTTAQLIGNDLWRIVRRMRAEVMLKENLAELTLLNARLDETNNKLLQSEKLASIGQLAAGVAHEINNPIGYVSSNLNSLAGYVNDLLAIDSAYNAIEERYGASIPQAFTHAHQLKDECDHSFIIKDIHHLLDESRQGLERVRKIVQDLKDFSRVGGTGWERVNLHRGLESTLNILWNEIKYKAEVDREYGDLPEVYCIPSQINQVFMNLLTNAAQAIEGSGEITSSPPQRVGKDEFGVRIEQSPTTVQGHLPGRPCAASSSPSTPPSRWARAQVSVFHSPGALSSAIAARSRHARNLAREQGSGLICRLTRKFPLNLTLRQSHERC